MAGQQQKPSTKTEFFFLVEIYSLTDKLYMFANTSNIYRTNTCTLMNVYSKFGLDRIQCCESIKRYLFYVRKEGLVKVAVGACLEINRCNLEVPSIWLGGKYLICISE